MGIIEDGAGTGNKARVNDNNKLLTLSETIPIDEITGLRGDGFVLSSTTINLTSGNETAIGYIKNNSQDILSVSGFVLQPGFANGAAATGEITLKAYTDITGGTIVSNANDITYAQNLNFGQSNIIDADLFEGQEGDTFTGRVFTENLLVPGIPFASPNFGALPRGKTLGFSITPPASTTSMNLTFLVSIFFVDGLIELEK